MASRDEMITLSPLNRDRLALATKQAQTEGYTIREGGSDEYLYVYDPAVRLPYTVIIFRDDTTGQYRASCDCTEFRAELQEWDLPCAHIAAAASRFKRRHLERSAKSIEHIAPAVIAAQMVAAPARCECGNVLDPDRDWHEGICNDCHEAQMDSLIESIQSSLAPRTVFACGRRAS